MNHYPRHIGDWMTATAHLSPMEEVAYSRMIDLYYAREAPLPNNPLDVSRLIRLPLEADLVRAVLREFFSEQDDGWHNRRCDAEIAAYRERVETARANGKAGGRPKKTDLVSDPETGLVSTTETETLTNQNQNHKEQQQGFEDFWRAYPATPRKAAKAQCLALWKTRGLGSQWGRIVAHVQAMSCSPDWTKDGGAFVPAPLVYLRQARYDAPLPTASQPSKTVAL